MQQFKVDDRVVYTGAYTSYLVGKKGTVVGLLRPDSVEVLFEGDVWPHGVKPENISLESQQEPPKTVNTKKLYLIASLRNEEVIKVHKQLEQSLPGVEVFSSWFAAGPEADDFWRDYEQGLGRSYEEALQGYAAKHVFEFDKHHLDTSDGAVLLLPAGKSGHLELGYMAGKGKVTGILLDNPDRWDVMNLFADVVTEDLGKLVQTLKEKL